MHVCVNADIHGAYALACIRVCGYACFWLHRSHHILYICTCMHVRAETRTRACLEACEKHIRAHACIIHRASCTVHTCMHASCIMHRAYMQACMHHALCVCIIHRAAGIVHRATGRRRDVHAAYLRKRNRACARRIHAVAYMNMCVFALSSRERTSAMRACTIAHTPHGRLYVCMCTRAFMPTRMYVW